MYSNNFSENINLRNRSEFVKVIGVVDKLRLSLMFLKNFEQILRLLPKGP